MSKFGRWRTIKFSKRRQSGKTHYMAWCKCACGTKRWVRVARLVAGSSKSCGCLAQSQGTVHGACRPGKNYTGAYRSWTAMRSRCNYTKNIMYYRYGGRGIKVCPRWDDFRMFLADMGERPRGKFLDRIDNDCGYSPKNCRWATKNEQMSNRRSTWWVEYKGKRRRVKQLTSRLGVSYKSVWSRVKQRGWTIEEALEEDT